MDNYNTQPHPVDDVLFQYVTLLAEGIKQDRREAAVAELELQFLEQHGNGLFLDVPARVDLASLWAEMMDTRHHTRQYSQWLENGYFATGRFFGYFVVLFPMLGADGIPTGFTAYRLTGERFGSSAKFFTAPERVILNDLGEMVATAKPLPLGGSDNPTPEALRQWRKECRDLWKFKRLHKGLTPEQEAEKEERRRRWREDNNKDNGDNQSNDNQ